MPAPAALADTQCPLLLQYGGADAGVLLARYAAALAKIDALANDPDVAGLPATSKLDRAFDDLAAARGLMARERYVVGFIGLSNAGKSTSVNNIFDEEVCKSGTTGDATSSQPTRVLRGKTQSLAIEFLSTSDYTRRRDKIASAIGVSSPGTDAELLEVLKQPAMLEREAARPRKFDDIEYLRKFVNARGQHAGVLTPNGDVKANLPYDRRFSYTAHSKDGDGGVGSEVLLLKEARFFITNEKLPANLEVCDLPGLNSKRSIDDIVTWEYLPNIHGTFLFVNAADNINSEAILKVVGRVNEEFKGNTTGRVWVVFNKMDGLDGNHFKSADENIFKTFSTFLEHVGVPPAQVCFSAKKIWDRAKGTPTGTADPSFAAGVLSQPGDAPTPSFCPPEYRSAWEELIKDGGISRIRGLMLGEVAVSLAARIRADVKAKLDDFDDQFDRVVQAEKARLAGGTALFEKVNTCHDVVMDLFQRLGRRPSDFPILAQQGDQLKARLGKLFESDATVRVLNSLPSRELAGQFKTHARVLNETLKAELSGEMLDRVYESIGRELEPLPQVPVGPGRVGCNGLWQVFRKEDRAADAWRAGAATFSGDEFRAWLATAGDDGIDGGVYLELMQEKITVTVHQAVHAVRARLRSRLGELRTELALLMADPDDAGPGSDAR